MRNSDASTVHSLVKNAAHALAWQVQDDPGIGAETRSLINRVLVVSEEARQLVLGGGVVPNSIELLWRSVRAIVPSTVRDGLRLEPASYEVQMSKTDYGLARRVLQDLITNAWKANSTSIQVALRVAPEPAQVPGSDPNPIAAVAGPLRNRDWVSVEVSDNGSGVAPGALADPRSSLHVLGNHLQRYGGTVLLTAGATGTCACAQWRASPR
ncbi:MAG: hypothetical protein ACRDOA_03010 [Streptosporangiaceae bacterium]